MSISSTQESLQSHSSRACSSWSSSAEAQSFRFGEDIIAQTGELLSDEMSRGRYRAICLSGPTPTCTITDPQVAASILSYQRNGDTEGAAFVMSRGTKAASKIVGKHSLMLCPVNQHPKLRRYLESYFSFSEVRKHSTEIFSQANQLADFLVEQAKCGDVKINQIVSKYCCETFARIVLRLDDEHMDICEAIDTYMKITDSMMLNMYHSVDWRAFSIANAAIERMVKFKINKGEEGELIFDMAHAINENGVPLFTTQDIIDTVKQMLITSKESVGTALIYLLYELGIHTKWQKQILSDWKTSCKDAESFNPGRFLTAKGEESKPCYGPWLVFEKGPNKCLGRNFAMLQLRLSLITFLNRFQWKTKNAGIKDAGMMTLQTNRKVVLNLKMRSEK